MESAFYKIFNPKKCFDMRYDKDYFILSKSNSYVNMRQKQLSMEIRLYYEFEYCQKMNGRVYFLTFTYNNNNIPYFLGEPCPDKKDMQRFLNHSRFARNLEKIYGYKFKYFCATELGDGKGKRGIGKNPHFHVIFFLYPTSEVKSMSDEQFNILAKTYWQGLNDNGTLKDYKSANYGHVSTSDKGSRVNDFRAIGYTAKYVLKDIYTQQRDKFFKHHLAEYISNEISKYIDAGHEDFDFYKSPEYYIDKYGLHKTQDPYGWFHQCEVEWLRPILKLRFQTYYELLSEYKNRYSTKPMFSHNLGLYALDFVTPLGKVKYYSNNNICYVTLPLYLYRKFFCTVEKSQYNFTINKNGKKIYNNIYVHTKQGIELLYRQFLYKLDLSQNVLSALIPTLQNSKLVDEFINFQKEKGIYYETSTSTVIKKLQSYEFRHSYFLYNYLYKGRYFPKTNTNKLTYNEINNYYSVGNLDIYTDFVRFHTYNECVTTKQRQSDIFESYDVFPPFAQNLHIYCWIDDFQHFILSQSDERSKAIFYEKARCRRNLKPLKKYLCV
ncbi:replication initiator protein [Capybara microvirus Cap1_SP_70]|nr:replication initiator protein [Capybara microvirus Cap1_SP_70]